MDKSRDIRPVEPVLSVPRAKPLGRIRLFKRPDYMPKKQQDQSSSRQDFEEKNDDEQLINHAHHVPEKIGEHIDFKV